MAPFNLPQIKAITDHDDMDLYTLGEKKCALYAVIPDNDNTFNFLVSLLYSQAFQALYYSADQIHHGALPHHVHFVLDEFAAMPLPGFTRELATMRSRNISASTIIQNMAQIKELYKDSWETIPGNSDTILYLGGNEASTHKYISEALGKATIDTRTHGQSKGRSGSWSTNFQMSGRELLTPDEVRALDNRYAILFIRGAKPVMDLKYDLTRHPAIRHTVDGGGPPYIHHRHQTPAFTGSGNWIVDNLNSALNTWNNKLAEIWQLISTSPEEFKGGGIWDVIVGINGGLQAIGYALLVLFFVMGIVKTCGSFTEFKKPELVFKSFIRFILAQAAVGHGMELMMAVFRVAQGMVSSIISSSGLSALTATTLPDEMVTIIEDVGLIESIPLWAVTLLGSLFIWVLALVMILTVYSRFFKLYIATAIAPVPLASFAGQPSSSIGMAFVKSYAAICLEGCVIVLACVIFSAFASTPPAIVDSTLAPATIVWNYVGELVFNMLVLVGAIKMSDRLIRELMGLG